MSQRRHVQVVRMVRGQFSGQVRVTEPIPSAAQRTLFYHLRDMMAQIAQDASYPGPWRQRCEEAFECLSKDMRTVF